MKRVALHCFVELERGRRGKGDAFFYKNFFKKIFVGRFDALNLEFSYVFNTIICLKKGYLDRVDYD